MSRKRLRVIIIAALLATAGVCAAGIAAYSVSLDSSASFPVDI